MASEIVTALAKRLRYRNIPGKGAHFPLHDTWSTIAGAALVWAIDSVGRETLLFAAVAFVIGGIDDLVLDLFYLGRRAVGRGRTPTLDSLPAHSAPARLAIFVPAWDESAVIGAMLTTAIARIEHADYRIFVGCYPNDPATIAAVADIAGRDARVRLVIGERGIM